MTIHVTFYSGDCFFAKIENDDKKILSNFLSDSGGSGVDHLVDMISDFVDVLRKTPFPVELSTNSWSALVSKEITKIYFIDDEDFLFEIKTNYFIEIISKWLIFISSGHCGDSEFSFSIA